MAGSVSVVGWSAALVCAFVGAFVSRSCVSFVACSRVSCPGLRFQLDEVGRERQVQRQGARRAEALAEWSVELAQAMVPQAFALVRGGG